MAVSAYTQDPNDITPYGIEWELNPGDTIVSSVWSRFKDDGVTATTEIAIGTEQMTNTPTPKTAMRLSYPAPVVGTTHHVVNQVTTAAGLKGSHTLIVLCQEA